MRFATAITVNPDARQAVDELLAPIHARLTTGMADVVCLFVTAHYDDDLEDIVDRLCDTFPGAALIGCTAEGIIGCGKELERTPAIALLVASLPGVDVRPFYLLQKDLENVRDALDWERIVAVSPESHPVFVAMADPFRFAIHDFLDQINRTFQGAALVGGVASAAVVPGQNRLILNGDVYREGLVGAALSGRLSVATVVSQGCRPIGKPFVITRAERNIIRELGGRSALEQLHQVLVSLEAEDERLARESLFVGRVIDEYKDHFARGDFLIHNIIGVDRQSGALAIAGHARTGATVQFHVRDAASADEDLRAMLGKHRGTDVRGAMLFGCNGRGSNMWPTAGHDITVLRELLGDVPTAGFFCGGEFGPIGGRNFVHGFTASIALFREPSENEKANA